MANRVLLGKSSGAYNGTTIRTRASNGLGLWLSQSGSDVLTCPDSELIFASDASGNVGGSIAGNIFEVVGYVQMGPYASASLYNYSFVFPSLHYTYVNSTTPYGTTTYKQTINGYSRALPPLILLFYQESIYQKPYLGHYQQFDWERVNTAGFWTTTDVVGGERGGGLFGNIQVSGGGYESNGITAYSGSGREYGVFRHGAGARINIIVTAVVTNLPLRG